MLPHLQSASSPDPAGALHYFDHLSGDGAWHPLTRAGGSRGSPAYRSRTHHAHAL